jgi:hypothetical protein
MPYVYLRSIEPLIAIILDTVCGSDSQPPDPLSLLGRLWHAGGLLSSADDPDQSRVQNGMMLFFIYWSAVLDPATYQGSLVPLQRAGPSPIADRNASRGLISSDPVFAPKPLVLRSGGYWHR